MENDYREVNAKKYVILNFLQCLNSIHHALYMIKLTVVDTSTINLSYYMYMTKKKQFNQPTFDLKTHYLTTKIEQSCTFLRGLKTPIELYLFFTWHHNNNTKLM